MKEQEEALRRSIRLEFERNRDEETRQKRKRDDDESEIFEMCLRAERRRKLIARRIIANHRKSTDDTGTITQSDSLVDCLEQEENEEERVPEENIQGEDEENSLVAAVKVDGKDNMPSENEIKIFPSTSLIDCLEKEESEDQVEESSVVTDNEECSLVTVTLDSIGEQDNVSSEFLSLDSIAL